MKIHSKSLFAFSLLGSLLLNTTFQTQGITFVPDSIRQNALTLAYGWLGYKVMSLSKEAGKRITNDVLKLPQATTAHAIVAQDIKFVANTAIKQALAKGIVALPWLAAQPPALPTALQKYMTLQFSDANNKDAFNGKIFDSGNKAVSLYEFWEYAQKTLAEIEKLPQKASEVDAYFYNFALRFTKDPHAAAIAASYLMASFMTCVITRQLGKAFNEHVSGFMPVVAKDPLDKIIPTTVGMLLSSFFQDYLVVPTLDKTCEYFGTNNTEMKNVATQAYKAGSKGPFAIDSFVAIGHGICTFSPKTCAHGSRLVTAAAMTFWRNVNREPRLHLD